MTVQWSPTVRNGQGDRWETDIGPSPKIQLFTGAQPANTAAAETGTKLAEFALAADWSPAASGGAKTLSGLPLISTGLAAGNAGHYRIVDAAGTVCHEQGSVGSTGSDMVVDNPSIALNQTVQITAYTKTWPGA